MTDHQSFDTAIFRVSSESQTQKFSESQTQKLLSSANFMMLATKRVSPIQVSEVFLSFALICFKPYLKWFNFNGHPAKSNYTESEVFNEQETKTSKLH